MPPLARANGNPATYISSLRLSRLRSLPVKFTIFGLTLSSSWGNGHATPYRSLIRALDAQGHQVTFFERENAYYAKHRDFTECDYCELVFYPEWDSVRESALRRAADSDIVITASYLSEGA